MLREKTGPQRRWIAARRELGGDDKYRIQWILGYLICQTKETQLTGPMKLLVTQSRFNRSQQRLLLHLPAEDSLSRI